MPVRGILVWEVSRVEQRLLDQQVEFNQHTLTVGVRDTFLQPGLRLLKCAQCFLRVAKSLLGMYDQCIYGES